MAKSNAERQRAYRERHLKDADGKGERINTVVTLSAKRSLERLASCYGVTQRAMLEQIIAEAEDVLLSGFSSRKQSKYYDKQLTIEPMHVTA
jgi:hypothetical protein